MGVQTQADSGDDCHFAYEEILTPEELQMLEEEFRPRLKNACFLDHSGATLYARSQIDAYQSELQSNLFSNPHSRNPSSSITTDAIDCVRLRILQHFGTTAEDYSVIFTSGATSALKLVAESFRFNGGTFAYCEESHTSVVGMREVVATIKPVEDQIKENKKAPVRREEEEVGSDSPPKVYCLAKATLEKLMDSECSLNCSSPNLQTQYYPTQAPDTLISSRTSSDQQEANALVVYPAQCNFSGYKYPLDWIVKIQHGHLDDINGIDHFYIEPHQIVGGVVEEQAHEVPGRQGGHNQQENKCIAAAPAPVPNQKKHSSKLELNKLQKQQEEQCVQLGKVPPQIKNECLGNGNINEGAIPFMRPPSIQGEKGETGEALGRGIIGESGGAAEEKDNHYYSATSARRTRRGGKSLNWFVLLDAASYVATNALDLSLHPADFIVLSFYKMFGFPTGLGALIVRNEASSLLKKRYFGGGTVNIAIPSKPFHAKRHLLHEKFEDGTISFLSIIALRHGFDTLNKLGRSLDTISTRVFRLAQYFYKNLVRMEYSNGQPVAVIYSDTKYDSQQTQGPIVTFNLLRRDGTIIGYSEMEQIAYLHDVHLRYGCFCNVGACRRHLGLDPEDVLKHYDAGHVCGDMKDLIDGKPTGAIRVSFGYMTTQKDVEVILKLIHTCWVRSFQTSAAPDPTCLLFSSNLNTVLKSEGDEKGLRGGLGETAGASHLGKGSTRKLSRIFVYPVKSCAPIQVSRMWAIGSRGLLYDRDWLIVNSSGVPLTQKREPRLCQLKPNIDISNRRLVLSMEGFPSVSVPLEMRQVEQELELRGKTLKAYLCTSKVCGDTVTGVECGEEVNNWLSNVFNRPGLKLLQMAEEQTRIPRNAIDEISLANFSQFLLVSMGSLRHLAQELLDRNVDFIQRYSSHQDSQIVEDSYHQPKLDSHHARNENQDNGTDEDEPSESKIRTGCSRIDQNDDQDRVRLQQKPRMESSPITTSTIGSTDRSSSNSSSRSGLIPPLHSNGTTMRKVHQNEKERLEITKEIVEDLIGRFRPNLVITDESDDGATSTNSNKSLLPYEEESWDTLSIGTVPLKSGGACLRCATICMDQKTGQRGSEPFLTLSATRQGTPNFGIHTYRRKGDFPQEDRQGIKRIVNGGVSIDSEEMRREGEEDKAAGEPRGKKQGAGLRMISSSPHSSLSSSSSSLSLGATSSSASVTTIHIGDPVFIETRTKSTLDSLQDEKHSFRGHRLHHHRNANASHTNANGNLSATRENRKIIDSID